MLAQTTQNIVREGNVTRFTCDRCKREIAYESNFTTGYGRIEIDGREEIHCYDCCALNDLETMKTTGRITLYLTKHYLTEQKKTYVYQVTNWPGTLKIDCSTWSRGRHNWAGKRIDVWFTDPFGSKWHGVQYGHDTQLCHCKRLK